jgi:hypothetical protein
MVFLFAPCGGATRHRETWIHFKRFLIGNWKNLQEFFLWAFGGKSKLGYSSPT